MVFFYYVFIFYSRKLAQAEESIAVNALQLLAKNRRKTLLENLLKSLRFIKTLQQTDLRLKELLQVKSLRRIIIIRIIICYMKYLKIA